MRWDSTVLYCQGTNLSHHAPHPLAPHINQRMIVNWFIALSSDMLQEGVNFQRSSAYLSSNVLTVTIFLPCHHVIIL